MKTARFNDVVAKSGHPELHLTWSAPASDKVLQAALKQHRVVTVYQQTRGSKKDHGIVGLEAAPQAQYLIFPKSLRLFADRKIIGINYDLLRKGLSMGGQALPPRAPRKASAPRTSKPRTPKPQTSNKVVRFEAPERALPPIVPKTEAPATSLARVQEPEETDPVKREIRRAISDLKAGHTLKARKRLEGLLED